MTDYRVWTGLDELVPLADTELECEKAAQGAKTPPAEEPSPNDNCSAKQETRSDRRDLNLLKRWNDHVL